MYKNDYILGIDIGGTKIAYGLVNENGEIKDEINKLNTPKSAKEIEILLKSIIKRFEDKIKIVAIATAGACNLENTGIVSATGNMPKGYSEINFQKLSMRKVFVENDANAAAWCEYKIGACKNQNNCIVLTLGTGVGGGIIVNGKILKGKNGLAGEMHFPLSREKKRPCTCGFYDCFEAYASGNGLKQTGSEIYNREVTTYEIISAIKNKDNLAIKAISRWENDIAYGIVGLGNIFDPETIVLSGSMAQFVNCEKIEEFVNKYISTSYVSIKKAEFKNNAGLIGVSLLAINKN